MLNCPNAYDKRPNLGMKSYRMPPKLFGRKNLFRKKQTLRLSFQRKPFQKSYKQQFTDELFTVARVSIPRNCSEPITYVLHDNNGEEILGRFYASELVAFNYDEDRHCGRQQVCIAVQYSY